MGARMKKIFLLLGLIGALTLSANAANGESGDAPLRGEGRSFKGHIGLQLYSLRDSFGKDVEGSLDKVKAFGFKYVELASTYGKSNEEMKKLLSDRGLVMVAGHFGFDELKNDPEAVGKRAQELGLRYVGTAWVPHQAPFDAAQATAAAEVFNNAGKVLAKYGVKFYYHNHGYEFYPWMNGKKIMDLLMEKTDPNYVTFQMDVMWTLFPGEDPAAWLAKYPNRWELIHLKDLKLGVEGNLSGGTDTKNDVVLGTGQVNYPKVLKAAQEAGVLYYFIEDESPTVEEQLPLSLDYLERVRF